MEIRTTIKASTILNMKDNIYDDKNQTNNKNNNTTKNNRTIKQILLVLFGISSFVIGKFVGSIILPRTATTTSRITTKTTIRYDQMTDEKIETITNKNITTTATNYSHLIQYDKKLRFRGIYPIIWTTSSTNYVNSSSSKKKTKLKAFPCIKPKSQYWKDYKSQLNPTKTGFFFMKPYKTGSSTTSGITLRIARNNAKRIQEQSQTKGKFEYCKSRFIHGIGNNPAYTLFNERNYDKSFLWTIIREPTKRAISMFFHMEVSRYQKQPTNKNFMEFLRRDGIKDYYLQTLYTKGPYSSTTRTTIDKYSHGPQYVGNSIINEYNFIGTIERLDESLVILMILLDLKLSDILYVSAKRNGNYDDGGYQNKCVYIWPSFVTDNMKNYFDSNEWKKRTQYDLAFYNAINASIDFTIQNIGYDRFYKQLNRFRFAQNQIELQCANNITFPCTKDGKFITSTPKDCLWKDSGCGTSCIDQVATDLKLW